MDRKVRIIQYGCGGMGTLCLEYAIGKGAEIVAAYDRNSEKVGKDIGEIIGTSDRYGVQVASDAKVAEEIANLNADIAVVTTRSELSEVYDIFKLCAENGVNIISTCEEAIFPWNSNPKLTQEIDEIAKRNNCTIAGSGAQELQWGSTVVNVASGFNNITKIVIENINNTDFYGDAFTRAYGVGVSEEEFKNVVAAPYGLSDEETKAKIESGDFVAAAFWNSNEWLARRLGLTLIKQEQYLEPIFAEKEVESTVLKRTIKKGEIVGASQKVISQTEEGIVIEGSNIATVHEPDDPEACNFAIYDGDVVIHVDEMDPPIPKITCSMMINRIPTIINAEPGYITTDKLPETKYLPRSLECYID